MNKEKVYLRFIDGEYYGDSFEWDVRPQDDYFNTDTWPHVDTQDARVYTAEAIKHHLDALSEFIRPSVLLDFIKTIEDINTGEAIFDTVQENVKYVLDLVKKIFTVADAEQASEFNNYVFGKHEAYGNETECHLYMFNDPETFRLWLRPHEQFVNEFKYKLKARQDLYLLAYDDKSLQEAHIKQLKERIKYLEAERDRVNLNLDMAYDQLAEAEKKLSK